MKTAIPQCQKCGRSHRHWHTVARCLWPNALWIAGTGQWATLSRCHPGGTVALHESEESARKALELIDKLACGGRCRRSHSLINLAEV